MAKKIKFPLKMEDGIEVRTLDELKEHFSISDVLAYLENGKLMTWLRDRFENELADALEGLDLNNSNLAMQICEIFDVEVDISAAEDMRTVQNRNRKIAILREFTDEDEYFDIVDQIAFNQEDLYNLLNDDLREIYLFGEKFSIPLNKKGVTYIGINKPVVDITTNTIVNFAEKEIVFKNVCFDKAYEDLLNQSKIKSQKDLLKILNEVRQKKENTFAKKEKEIIDNTMSSSAAYKQEESNYGVPGLGGWHKATDELIAKLEEINGVKKKPAQRKPTYVRDYIVIGDKIVYTITDYENSRTQSDFGCRYYVCDFAWENSREIYCILSSGYGFHVKDLYYKNGRICSQNKIRGEFFGAEYEEISFDFEEELEKSKTRVTRVYNK